MAQTPRHVDQDTLDKMNKEWYHKGWLNGLIIGAAIATIIALGIVMVAIL